MPWLAQLTIHGPSTSLPQPLSSRGDSTTTAGSPGRVSSSVPVRPWSCSSSNRGVRNRPAASRRSRWRSLRLLGRRERRETRPATGPRGPHSRAPRRSHRPKHPTSPRPMRVCAAPSKSTDSVGPRPWPAPRSCAARVRRCRRTRSSWATLTRFTSSPSRRERKQSRPSRAARVGPPNVLSVRRMLRFGLGRPGRRRSHRLSARPLARVRRSPRQFRRLLLRAMGSRGRPFPRRFSLPPRC